MKYEELCDSLISECEPGCNYVVEITSAYDSELGQFGECTTYEIFCIDYDNNIIWFDDWYEGQDYCYYEEAIKINALIRAYNITEQIKGLKGWPEDCYEQILQIFEKAGDPI